HLSADINTAKIVGKRRGKPLVLQIDTVKMSEDGYKFFCSDNGVWLVDEVPPQYLQELADFFSDKQLN
ncbi:MAG: RNA 2'-phosphotransferase, partial [Spirulinaceae cyanobacterium]